MELGRPRRWVLLLLASWVMFPPEVEADINMEAAFDPVEDALKGIVDMVKEVKESLGQLARQTMSQQLFVEERIRSDGHSGIKQTRTQRRGTDAYFTSTHINKGAAAMHSHSNSRDILGMGECVVVLNGVDFRTRHNDYHLRQVSTTDTSYNAVEPVKFPDVPPEVLSKPTVQEQVLEMREWIKAFHSQDYSVRDYRKYFRPVMCYIEGGWTLDKSLVEPFTSQRHSLEADTWQELQQQIMYTSYTGGKHLRENFAYLPTTIISVNETTGEPLYAHWNYRILCHPYSGDIPTKYFRLQDDMAYRQATRRTLSRVNEMRAARYRLSEFDTPQYTWYTLLDEIMSEIPGKDNIPPLLNELPIGQTLYDSAYKGDEKLNTGFYHRRYRTGTPSASGTLSTNRAFSDEQLFFAETTREQIAPVAFTHCYDKRRCVTRSTRFTYAIPLEVVYLTPLLTWNPYNLTIWDNHRIPVANNRRGHLNEKRALNGTSYINNYYLTPETLYTNVFSDEPDPADTVRARVGVLDQEGRVVVTVSSGVRILLPEIPGIGAVRLRYPVFPLHVEGSPAWKELQVVKLKLKEVSSSLKNNLYHIKLRPTKVSGLHDHDFYLTQTNYDAAISGQVVSVTTSTENGHNHELDIVYKTDRSRLEYVRCGNQDRCWDWHDRALDIVSAPGEE